MKMTARSRAALVALVIAIGRLGDARAQDGVKPKPAPVIADKTIEAEISRYCVNVAPTVAEARVAYETKRMMELKTELEQRIADLEKREADARDWVTRREAMLKTASDDIVAIYAKMDAEAAAAEVAAMEDPAGAAILAKLKPAVASAILGAMDADKAARLSGLIGGATQPEKKS